MEPIFQVPKNTKFPSPVHYMHRRNLLSSTDYSKVFLTKYYRFHGKIKSKHYCVAKLMLKYSPEYYITKNLTHPNVLSPLGRYIARDTTVIFYPYLPGGDLNTWLKKHKYISELDIRNLFQQMTSAVRYIASVGIVHHDIKTENFVISNNGKVKLIDFGHAQQHPKVGKIEGHIGTPLFMAPEVLNEPDHTYSCDVWSLGICLYTLLYRKTPYDHVKDIDTLKIEIRKEIHLPEFPVISYQCEDLLRKILVQNPEQRPTPSEILKHNWFMIEDQNLDGVLGSDIIIYKKYKTW